MTKLTIQEKIFVGAVTAGAALLLLWLFLAHYYLEVKVLLFFGLLSFAAENLGIELPQGGSVSVSSTIILTTIIIFGPLMAAGVAVFNAVIWVDIKERTSPFHWLFNGGEGVLTAGLAGLFYLLLGGRLLLGTSGFTGANLPRLLPPIILMSISYFLLNTGLVSGIISLEKRTSPLNVWYANVLWAIPNYFVLAILALIMTQIYLSVGAVGLLLMIVPLLIARQTFQIYLRLKSAYMGTISALIAALEAKDPYTSGHSERVADLAVRIGRRLRLKPDELEVLRNAGILHDIGKIGIAHSILRNTGRLSEEEYRRMQKHPETGALILQEIKFMDKVIPAVFHHHEHYDGSGYVDGFKGEEIPLYSRILAVADAYDAMTSPRPYRPAMAVDAACRELSACSGTQFDARIVEVFLKEIGYQTAEEEDGLKTGQLKFDELLTTKNISR